jgi:hypothetical protein
MFHRRIAAVAAACIACLWTGSQALAQDRHPSRLPLPAHKPGYPVAPPHKPAPRGQWWDGAHGHAHYYPATGWRVHAPPRHVHWVPWHGVRYGYVNGVWYAPYGNTFVVARPPVGVVISALPAYRTVVTLGGASYLYANGVYYREHAGGGYEVVPSPIVGDAASQRTYVYPKLNQSAEKQASDEYECHRWAVDQTGFDPTAAATGQGTGPAQRSDYVRAQTACLEGRGYTVR